MVERKRWRPSKKTTTKIGGLLLGLSVAGSAVHLVEYDNVNNYPPNGLPHHPSTTLYLDPNTDTETALAQAIVPYFSYAKSEEERANNMVILYDIQELTDEQVELLFSNTPEEGEKWFAGLFAATDPRDGGPDRIGLQFGDHILALGDEGLHLVSKISKIIKEDQHPGDVEEAIIFLRLKGNTLTYEGAYIWQHGSGKYFDPHEFEYLKDERGNLHIKVHRSMQKGTIYPSSRACNTSKAKVDISLKIAETHITDIHLDLIRDRCAREEDSFILTPKIETENNFGDDQNPFKNNPEIGFGKYENVHNRCFYGDYFDNYESPKEVETKKKEMPCASSFRTSVPMLKMK